MNVCSYTGYYNGHYLRSSYEYIYAKILESQNIEYGFEESNYILSDGSTYKPDFFIYKNNELIKIVEIKSENKKRLIEAKRKIKLLNEILDTEVILYTSYGVYSNKYKQLLDDLKKLT